MWKWWESHLNFNTYFSEEVEVEVMEVDEVDAVEVVVEEMEEDEETMEQEWRM